jgi:phosphohistidine phosphatase SixA
MRPASTDTHNGGFVIVFRHDATYQDQADPDPLNPKNIGQQRQLNDDSRTLAKSIGESLSKLRIPVGQVHTSLFQRAIDTGAMMGFGEVKASADYTEGGLMVTTIENNRRADALRKIVATVPPPGTNVIVVTHKPNILDAFGKDWFDVREGERLYSSQTETVATSQSSEFRQAPGVSSPKIQTRL